MYLTVFSNLSSLRTSVHADYFGKSLKDSWKYMWQWIPLGHEDGGIKYDSCLNHCLNCLWGFGYMKLFAGKQTVKKIRKKKKGKYE